MAFAQMKGRKTYRARYESNEPWNSIIVVIHFSNAAVGGRASCILSCLHLITNCMELPPLNKRRLSSLVISATPTAHVYIIFSYCSCWQFRLEAVASAGPPSTFLHCIYAMFASINGQRACATKRKLRADCWMQRHRQHQPVGREQFIIDCSDAIYIMTSERIAIFIWWERKKLGACISQVITSISHIALLNPVISYSQSAAWATLLRHQIAEHVLACTMHVWCMCVEIDDMWNK